MKEKIQFNDQYDPKKEGTANFEKGRVESAELIAELTAGSIKNDEDGRYEYRKELDDKQIVKIRNIIDKESALKVVGLTHCAFEYLDPKYRADREVVLEAIRDDRYGCAHILKLASPELQADKEVVLEAVRRDDNAVNFISPKLKADKYFMRDVMKASFDKLYHFNNESPEVSSDDDENDD